VDLQRGSWDDNARQPFRIVSGISRWVRQNWLRGAAILFIARSDWVVGMCLCHANTRKVVSVECSSRRLEGRRSIFWSNVNWYILNIIVAVTIWIWMCKSTKVDLDNDVLVCVEDGKMDCRCVSCLSEADLKRLLAQVSSKNSSHCPICVHSHRITHVEDTCVLTIKWQMLIPKYAEIIFGLNESQITSSVVKEPNLGPVGRKVSLWKT